MKHVDTHSRLHLVSGKAPTVCAGVERCGCEKCNRRMEIDATFTPWQKDPERIARLLLWLDLIGESPRSVRAIAEFIRDPTPWSTEYADMCVFEHPKPGEVS